MLVSVKNSDRSTLVHRGPCMTCGEPDIPYGRGDGRGLSGTHVQYGDEWLHQKTRIVKQRPKPFVFCDYRDRANPNKGMIVELGYGNKIGKVNGIGYAVIEPYLCVSCRAELQHGLSEWWQIQCEREEAERQAKAYEKTWRRPERDEFGTEQGEWCLGLVAPTLELRSIRFRWRTSKLFCQGSSPAFVMMMTIDDRLAGRCYAKYDPAGSDELLPVLDLEPCEEESTGHESIDAREIVAANLFANWIQDHLQEDLRTVDAFEWDPRNPPMEFFNYATRSGYLVKTKWIDGSIYTALCSFLKFSAITAMLEKMAYRLIPDRSKRQIGEAARY